MFLQIANIKSTMVTDLKVNAGESQAIVTYNNGTKYLYNGVDFNGLYELIYRDVESIGQWVINNLKVESVKCIKL